MRLQRIYSSKLYVTSSRKDKIHAAMQDPINAELVQQLAEYLDDDGQAELQQAVKEEKAEQASAQQAQAENADMGMSSGGGSSRPSAGGGSRPSFTGNVFDDFGGDDFEGDDTPDDIPMDDSAPEPETPVEETTKIKGRAINAACQLWTTLDDVISDCETIKGTLNAREDTAGVSRLQVKDAELWIYYNDDANLNDKMVDVIEVLNSTGYTYLTFSRLARSNNAIVFDISLNSQEQIKSDKALEDEK